MTDAGLPNMLFMPWLLSASVTSSPLAIPQRCLSLARFRHSFILTFLPWKSSWKIKHKSTIFSLKKVFVAIQCVHQRRQMAVPFFAVLLWSLDVALLMLNHGQDALYFWEIKESHAKLQRRQRELRIPLVRDPKSRYCFVVNQVRLTNKGKPCKTPEAAECTLRLVGHLKDPLTLTELPGK